MYSLFDVKKADQIFYERNIKDFIPDKIIDIHTHVHLLKHKAKVNNAPVRSVLWPQMVAEENSIEDLIETYRLMFPAKNVKALIFSSAKLDDDIESANAYISECSKKYGFPSLLYTLPSWTEKDFEERVFKGGFIGSKVYLNLAEPYIPEKEIRIFDFLPHHILKILDKHSWVAMLHIPRDGRLKDPVNLAQLLEIECRYPNVKLIVAHVGRAYCKEDLGNAMEILSQTQNMLFDFSANCNAYVFEQLIKAVGPRRILFGSDLPILRMRTRRICESGSYINLVPKGLYGDVSRDRHMKEVEGEEAEKLTFFMYEEIEAFRQAAVATGLTKKDIQDIFYNNADNLINSCLNN